MLRSACDGSVLCVMEKADVSALAKLAPGWRLPTPFQGVCADGVTPLFALIWWPSNYDTSKRYPVVEVRTRATQYATHTAFVLPSWYRLSITRLCSMRARCDRISILARTLLTFQRASSRVFCTTRKQLQSSALYVSSLTAEVSDSVAQVSYLGRHSNLIWDALLMVS